MGGLGRHRGYRAEVGSCRGQEGLCVHLGVSQGADLRLWAWPDQGVRQAAVVEAGKLCGQDHTTQGNTVCSGVGWLGCGWAAVALVSVWRALCTCPFAFWARNWLLPRPELAEAKGDAGLCFERQPGLDAGIGGRPGASPRWP